VEIWYTDKISNSELVDESTVLMVSVVRDIYLGAVTIYENGKRINAHVNTNGADALFTAFEQVKDEVDRSAVKKFEAADHTMTAVEVNGLFNLHQNDIDLKFVPKSSSGQPEPPPHYMPQSSGFIHQSKGDTVPSSGVHHNNNTRDVIHKENGVGPLQNEIPEMKIGTVHVFGVKRGGFDYPDDFLQVNIDFTLSMFLSVREVLLNAMLVDGPLMQLKIILSQHDTHCKYALRVHSTTWVSQEVGVERNVPVHFSVVYVQQVSILLYHQGESIVYYIDDKFIWASSAADAAPALTIVHGIDSIVLSFDVMQSALSAEQVRSLANLRVPPPVPRAINRKPALDLDIEHLSRAPKSTVHSGDFVLIVAAWATFTILFAGLAFFTIRRHTKSSKYSKVV
jgi:hypothetical protein